jgi:hypothetical protein
MFSLNTIADDAWGPPGGEDNAPGFVTSCPASQEGSTVAWYSTSWSSFNGLVSFVVFPDFDDISGWESNDITFSYVYYGNFFNLLSFFFSFVSLSLHVPG